jgi:hypothetical protein
MSPVRIDGSENPSRAKVGHGNSAVLFRRQYDTWDSVHELADALPDKHSDSSGSPTKAV